MARVTAEEQRRANEDEARKIKLENSFKPKLKSLFTRIARDFSVTVLSTGSAPIITNYNTNFEALLKEHYDKVQRVFEDTVKDQDKSLVLIFKEVSPEEQERLNDLLPLALLAWRDTQAKNQARILVDTTQENMRDALDEAREILREGGEEINNRNVATTATPILKRKLGGRVESIAMTETQSAAETTKFFEAQVISGLEPGLAAPALVASNTRKIWVTVGDKKVREHHRQAEGQVQKMPDPFLVGGELLMYPGDTSLGASAGNVVNCRCSAQYRTI